MTHGSETDPPAPRDPGELLAPVYGELRAIAARYFRRQPAGFTLRPTELVHEACLQILKRGDGKWTSPAHFRAIAARKMWQVIVDHHRRRNARKRGGPPVAADDDGLAHAPRRVALDPDELPGREAGVDLLDLADALEALSQESGRLHDVVVLHRFAGLTHAEVAEQLGISSSSAEKDYCYAVAWLRTRLNRDGADAD